MLCAALRGAVVCMYGELLAAENSKCSLLHSTVRHSSSQGGSRHTFRRVALLSSPTLQPRVCTLFSHCMHSKESDHKFGVTQFWPVSIYELRLCTL